MLRGGIVDFVPMSQNGGDQINCCLTNKLLGSFAKSSERRKCSEALVLCDFVEESTHHNCAFEQYILACNVVVLTNNAVTELGQKVQEKCPRALRSILSNKGKDLNPFDHIGSGFPFCENAEWLDIVIRRF